MFLLGFYHYVCYVIFYFDLGRVVLIRNAKSRNIYQETICFMKKKENTAKTFRILETFIFQLFLLK